MNQWFNKYTDIPYKLFGTDPTIGMDCFTLLCYVFKEEAGVKIPYTSSDFLKMVDDQWFTKTHEQHFLNGSKNGDWVEIDMLQPYDLILMCLGSTNVVNHVAMYVGNNKILQMIENRDSAIYDYHKYFRQYTVKKVRWKSLVN
jgi:cell wall-associated NlpC family hydrolase